MKLCAPSVVFALAPAVGQGGVFMWLEEFNFLSVSAPFMQWICEYLSVKQNMMGTCSEASFACVKKKQTTLKCLDFFNTLLRPCYFLEHSNQGLGFSWAAAKAKVTLGNDSKFTFMC